MNIKKIIKKVNEFFDLSEKKQIKKKNKLLNIIEKLEDKKIFIKKCVKKCKSKKEKEKLVLELEAVKNLLKKASVK